MGSVCALWKSWSATGCLPWVCALGLATGRGAIALYNYVEGREGLEELVVEAIIAGVVLPAQVPDWRADFTAVCTALWEGLRAHPNVIPLILTHRSVWREFRPRRADDRNIVAIAAGPL